MLGKRFCDSAKNLQEKHYLYDFALHNQMDWPCSSIKFVRGNSIREESYLTRMERGLSWFTLGAEERECSTTSRKSGRESPASSPLEQSV